MTLMGLLVALVLIGLIFWATHALASAFGIPAPIVTLIQVILVILVVLYILQAFGLYSGGPTLRLN